MEVKILNIDELKKEIIDEFDEDCHFVNFYACDEQTNILYGFNTEEENINVIGFIEDYDFNSVFEEDKSAVLGFDLDNIDSLDSHLKKIGIEKLESAVMEWKKWWINEYGC